MTPLVSAVRSRSMRLTRNAHEGFPFEAFGIVFASGMGTDDDGRQFLAQLLLLFVGQISKPQVPLGFEEGLLEYLNEHLQGVGIADTGEA